MFNLRIIYTKVGKVRFISHLDIIRTIQRALRRAELPVALSEGFSPHFQISYGQPLSLGIESECEFADVALVQEVKNIQTEVVDVLNKVLPEGIVIKDAFWIDKNKVKSLKELSENTIFYTELPLDMDFCNKRTAELKQGNITVERTRGETQQIINIKNFLSGILFKQEKEKIGVEFGLKPNEKGQSLSPYDFIKGFTGFENTESQNIQIKKIRVGVVNE